MRKPPTGEPCAGKPHARFGGRGGLKSFPTPIAMVALQPGDPVMLAVQATDIQYFAEGDTGVRLA